MVGFLEGCLVSWLVCGYVIAWLVAWLVGWLLVNWLFSRITQKVLNGFPENLDGQVKG